MKKVAVLICVLFLATGIFAQSKLEWAIGLSNSNRNDGRAVAADKAGNVYVTGQFMGKLDFDPGPGVFNMTCFDLADIFVLKFNAKGQFLWARKMAGNQSEVPYGIALDDAGNVLTTGAFVGTTDFDPGSGIQNLTARGQSDVFVCKLDTGGNFLWAKQFGGKSYENCNEIKIDAGGNIYFAGGFVDTADFDPGSGTLNLISKGSFDLFVCKLDPSGNLLWARSTGGKGQDQLITVNVEQSGHVYCGGIFSDTVDMDPGAGVANKISNGNLDLIILHLDASGNYVLASCVGGKGDDIVRGIAYQAGAILVSGTFMDTADFDPSSNTFQLKSRAQDIFIAKYDQNGIFIWAKNVGSKKSDECEDVLVDAKGNVAVAGYFQDTGDFDPGVGVFPLITDDLFHHDIFIVQLDPNGNFIWAGQMGGKSWDYCEGFSRDDSGYYYLTGEYQYTADMDPGPGVFNITEASQGDIFVAKIRLDPKVNSTEFVAVKKLTVYPNPANGIFHVQVPDHVGNGMINVYDRYGRLLHTQKAERGLTAIDIGHLAPGFYFIQMTIDNELFNGTLIYGK